MSKILLLFFTFVFLCVGSVNATPVVYDVAGEARMESKITFSGEAIIDDEYELVGFSSGTIIYKYKILDYKFINDSTGQTWEGDGYFIVSDYTASFFKLNVGQSDYFESDYEENVVFNDGDDYSTLPQSITFWEKKLTRLSGESLQDNLGIEWDGSIEYSGADIFQWTATKKVNPVPEPATIFLLSTGLLGLVFFRKNFKK